MKGTQNGLFRLALCGLNSGKVGAHLRVFVPAGTRDSVTFSFRTLPIPRRSDIPAALYMSWLEMISRDLPPTLFVRGNRTSVLSYFD
ncbi:unnamed protein product [Strongylus vulgaris]|uniref:SLC12A transporter C-terminal domain-containing protein n=1 Tax=Strongylus vulgaris TaxID=40348 RepID=A0A3P7J836_STRVU|nr:unnamed protein product [Strongylus vulgaris]